MKGIRTNFDTPKIRISWPQGFYKGFQRDAGRRFSTAPTGSPFLFIQPSLAAFYKAYAALLRVRPFHIIHSNPPMTKELPYGDIWRLFDEFRIT
jgi:hypothetical protein